MPRAARRTAVLFAAGALVLLGAVPVLTASNVVPATRAASGFGSVINADALKPADCASIVLSGVVSGSGSITGSSASELVLGSAGNDSIDAKQGNDCVAAGGGDDSLQGGAGTDVCIGGPGNDTFHATCETQIQ